jgi:hypothetical protein
MRAFLLLFKFHSGSAQQIDHPVIDKYAIGGLGLLFTESLSLAKCVSFMLSESS